MNRLDVVVGACGLSFLLGATALACSSSTATVSGTGDGGPTDSSATDASSGEDGSPDVGSPKGDGGSDAGGPNPLASIPADEAWHFVPFASAVCADGTETGIGVNFTSKSNDVLIHLSAGGGCWDEDTCAGACAINIHTGYDETNGTPKWSTYVSGTVNVGVFDRSSSSNPFASYNYVEVFYCTGDVHAGNNIASYTILGRDGAPHPTHHVGQANLLTYVAAIAPKFASAERFVLSGLSAGGFGSYLSYDAVAGLLPSRAVYLIDDSGPVLQNQFNSVGGAAVLQYENYGLAKTLSDCTSCNPATDGGGPVNLAAYISKKYPQGRMALLSSVNDDEIRQRYELDPSSYQGALDSLATDVLGHLPNWRHFYIAGSTHTMIDGFDLGATTACGIGITTFNGATCTPSLAAFLSDELDGGLGGWASVDPPDGAPGTAHDAGDLAACDYSH
jgi:hypothetical protein